MKKPILLSTVCLLLSALCFAVKYPKPQGYVSDFASVLDPASRQQLEAQLSEFERTTSNEIAVATVPSLEGDTVEDYAVRLFKEWGIGKKGKDNGVLILVAPNERKVRIEVGYGLEAVLPDGLAGQIIRENMTPYFKQGQYGQGILAAAGSIRTVLTGGSISLPLHESSENRHVSLPRNLFPILFVAFAAGIPFTVVCFVVALLMMSRFGLMSFFIMPLGFILDIALHHRWRGYSPGYYGGFGGGGFSGGGGFGGGGGFSGGSSGGGGASGGW